ncbi:Tn7-like element transposition protein TnsE [Bacillus atrophaeus]|uniref:Tn7-like element transposition protein TnsE n=1 Tax=Bacillus atrophaeus TaxID=1452 RepID=UPI0031BAAE1E
MKNKQIPYSEILFSHPEIVQTEKSGAKKYTIHSKSSNGSQQNELTLDEEVEGTTDKFDLIEMDNQVHEYAKLPKVTKIRRNSNMQRNFEDENTKRYFIDNQGKRATSDVGGNTVTKGLENKSLYDIQVQGEVQSINVNLQGSLKEFSDIKRFVYLSDGVTERKYVIAEIKLFSNKEVSVIEVEREDRALSTLICFINNQQNKSYCYPQILSGIIDSHRTWDKERLHFNKKIF